MANDSQPSFGIDQIVAELRELRSRQVSGMYYVVSDDNRQARISLVKGEIVSVAYRGVEGPQALARLASIRALRTRFSADGLARNGDSAATTLPPTEALLRALLHGGALPAAAARAADNPAAPASSGGGRKVAELSPGEQQWIRNTLTDYLGPIAGLVYDENRDPRMLVDVMVERLAQEIPSGQSRAAFLVAVRRGLRASG
jgi:hypothetical protein